ncbi:MAG: hypothetical protein GWP10_21120 [Nitrospiraceae bacterium]|nr:hypothetical protein [Nitrospiraceae bacterium]
MTLYMTRAEIIDDLPHAFREQNDLEAMSDNDLATTWVTQGTHAGTWDWDDIRVNLPTAILQLKLLRGRAVPEIGYPGHGFTGYDGMIMRVE